MSYFRILSILILLLLMTYFIILSIFYISPDLDSRKNEYINDRNNKDVLRRIELKNKRIIENINKPPTFSHGDILTFSPNIDPTSVSETKSTFMPQDKFELDESNFRTKNAQNIEDKSTIPTISAIKSSSGLPSVMKNPAIVIIHYNRLHYLTQTIASLSNLAHISDYQVYLSQDGPNNEAKLLAEKYKFTFLEHQRDAMANAGGTTYLARHYKRALDALFLKNNHSHVIIVEDDMIFSPDFLDFFEASAPVLEADPTLWYHTNLFFPNKLGVHLLGTTWESTQLFMIQKDFLERIFFLA